MQAAKIKILFVVTLFFSFLCNSAFAQQVAGYSFEKYPASGVYTGTKANISYKSNPTAMSHKAVITEGYKNSKINFGGHYVIVLWGAGTGLSLGAMVDVKTGNVYDLPLSEQNSVRNCNKKNDSDVGNTGNSNLFVTWNCNDEAKANNTVITTKNYSIYLWDDARKKFTLLKQKSIEKKTKN